MAAIAELDAKTLEELQEVAKDLNISNYRRFRKQELIMRILQAQTEREGLMFRSGILTSGSCFSAIVRRWRS